MAAYAARQTTPPKLVVDEDFLSRWEAGQISEQEHRELLSELADSQESREIVRLLTQSGALTLPDCDRDDMPQVINEGERPTVMTGRDETRETGVETPPVFASVSSGQAEQTSFRKKSRSALTTWLPMGLIAAGIAVAVTLSIMNPGGNTPLASARDALENNNLQEAFDLADEAIADADSVNERQEAFDIMCQSGEQLADTALTEGRFEDVRLISDRVSDHVDEDHSLAETATDATRELLGSIESLRLQARRGIDSAIAVPQVDSLNEFLGNGLESIGSDDGMTQMEIDAIREEYEQAIADFPLSRDLRLNFGQFLLEHQDTDAAIEQFRAVLEGNPVTGLLADPENRDAIVGLAIAVARDPSQASAMEAMEKLRDMFGEEGAADILNRIQGGLAPSLPSGLIPDGLIPSRDSLDTLLDSLQNRDEDDDEPAPADESDPADEEVAE